MLNFQGWFLSLFSYQCSCSLLFPLSVATRVVYHIFKSLSTTFFILFLKLFCFKMSVFKQLAYFIKVSSDCQVLFYFFWNISVSHIQPPICISTERRGWDSNPRALADKRFSRPPRYDHFDTSPYVFLAFCFVLFISDVDKYITTRPLCQHFFYFFYLF